MSFSRAASKPPHARTSQASPIAAGVHCAQIPRLGFAGDGTVSTRAKRAANAGQWRGCTAQSLRRPYLTSVRLLLAHQPVFVVCAHTDTATLVPLTAGPAALAGPQGSASPLALVSVSQSSPILFSYASRQNVPGPGQNEGQILMQGGKLFGEANMALTQTALAKGNNPRYLNGHGLTKPRISRTAITYVTMLFESLEKFCKNR